MSADAPTQDTFLMHDKRGFPHILEKVLYEIKKHEEDMIKSEDELIEYQNEIKDLNKDLKIDKTPENFILSKAIIELTKNRIKYQTAIIKNYKDTIPMWNVLRICIMRLIIIEKYILSNIWQYPLEYEYPCEPYEYQGSLRVPTSVKFSLKLGNDMKDKFFISLAVSSNHFRIVNDQVEWFCFADLMIVHNGFCFGRTDFGLSPIDYYDDKKQKDMLFRIYNFGELQKVLQKFDTWYGTTLD
jgi:hypothetical protein